MPAFLPIALLVPLGVPSPPAPQGEGDREPQGEDSAAAAIEVRELLVIPRLGRGGRSPVFTDAIEALRVHGELDAPAEGDSLELPDGRRRTWRAIQADESGRFSDDDLRGGYGFAAIEVPEAGVWMLEARGHRSVLVGGSPRGGDLYDLGLTRLPVELRAGKNELFFEGGRGSLAARLVRPAAPVHLAGHDRTLPDVVRGEDQPLWIGAGVVNATTEWQRGLALRASAPGAEPLLTPLAPLPPLSATKVAARVRPPAEIEGAELEVALELLDGAGAPLGRDALSLAVVGATGTRRHTFRSAIDGSVQYYAVTPMERAAEGAEEPPALFLSLHGASVEALGQARSYAPKDWGHVVAPTNRRPYGFDWEDWGRLDALEVLELASERYGADPARTYLTGHSMGGHGTWSVGAHHMDLFAAIAPSAGWRDFWAYGGAAEWEQPTEVERLLARAANASRTLLLERNFALGGVYVLHGGADEVVPVSQARFMRERLGAFHGNFAYYERPGAGHWWGDACVDWPPLFAFLRRNARPTERDVLELDFTTVSPRIASRCRWLDVEAQERWMEPSRVRARLRPERRAFELETENVQRLALRLDELSAEDGERGPRLAPGEPLRVTLDGGELDVDWPSEGAALRFERDADGAWGSAGPASPAAKGPHRAGPFKDVYRRDAVLVAGTLGTPEENAWALAKARYDAETFAYRGNGAFDVLLDVDFDPAAEPGRNVVLYGNRDTHALWEPLLGEAPLDAGRGFVQVGERRLEGTDLALLAIRPRPGSDVASVAALAGSGLEGMRLTDQLPIFVSGVAYPDWIVLESSMLERGSAGVVGAGFFATDWSLAPELAWRDDGP